MSILPGGEKYVHRGGEKGSPGGPGETRRDRWSGGVRTELRVWGRKDATCGFVSDRSVIVAAPRSPTSVAGMLTQNTAMTAHRTEPRPAMLQAVLIRESPECAWRASGWGREGGPPKRRVPWHQNGIEIFLKNLKTHEIYITAVCL